MNGLYRLRALTIHESDLTPGGMYATAQAPGKVVKVEAQTPPVMLQQIWRIEPAHGWGSNAVTIQAEGMDAPGGFTYWHNPSDSDDVNNAGIILDQPKHFRLDLIKEEQNIPIYAIYPRDAPPRDGATLFVGADLQKDIVREAWYPVIPDVDIPVWAFYPA